MLEAKAPLNYKFFLSTYALRELASDCGFKRSLAEVFGSQIAEQWLCYTIYQMVNGGSEDLYEDWTYHQILPTNAQKLSGQALRQQLLQECRLVGRILVETHE